MSTPTLTRQIGLQGPVVPGIGLGLMGLSTFYGNIDSDEERFKVLDRAIEIGQTFWDTADMYGDSEDLLGKYFKKNPDARAKVTLATKFANRWQPDGQVVVSTTPEYTKEACVNSLKRLGVDYIDLYYVHRVDGLTPIEKTIEALVELKNEGKIRHIGLSEVSARTLRRAAKVHHIAAVQVEYSPFELEAEMDDDRFGVIKAAKELGTAIVAYSPLGRGILTGQYKSADDFEEGDFRKMLDRYNEENFPKALKLVDEIAAVGKAHNASPGQATLAWLLAQGDHVIPIPGTKRIKYLEENQGALDVKLSASEVQRIRDAINATDALGDRYPALFVQELYGDTPQL